MHRGRSRSLTGPTATLGTTGRLISLSVISSERHGEIGRSSKLGSVCSNTEPGVSDIDFRIVALLILL